MELYKLQPAYADYLWGGEKLAKSWNKQPTTQKLAESWEVSFHPSGLSTIASGAQAGKSLADVITVADYGTNAASNPEFPILIKFIDAAQKLSVQVHPTDAYAKAHEGGFGKTEMWYILESDPGAGIYCGLRHTLAPEELNQHIEENTLMDVLNFIPVQPGESYLIPAGTIHAIGAGVVLLEIQQSSNLTYRVYDFGRLDADGNPRPLHIQKAKEVANLSAFAPSGKIRQWEPGMRQLAANRYFSVYEYTSDSKVELEVGSSSFAALTFLEGTGTIAGQAFEKGDSFFAPAGLGQVVVEGTCRFVLSRLMRYYVGIDLGGTAIKGAIIDEDGRFLAKKSCDSEAAKGSEHVVGNISRLIGSLLQEAGLSVEDVEGIGVGCPGLINGGTGEVVYSNNLAWKHVPMASMLQKDYNLPVSITNDANAAAVGEVRFGSGRQYRSAILVTLGTGLGGGVVIDGKLMEGNASAGAELGHMVVHTGGELCTCGRHGCLEAYASATALIREAKRAAMADKNSEMWQRLPNGNLDAMDARIPFDCRHTDKAAAQVVENYLTMLAEGLANFVNIFRPEAILIGGGVSNEGDGLIVPLQQRVDALTFGGNLAPAVPIKKAQLGNDAGVYGAAALLMQFE